MKKGRVKLAKSSTRPRNDEPLGEHKMLLQVSVDVERPTNSNSTETNPWRGKKKDKSHKMLLN